MLSRLKHASDDELERYVLGTLSAAETEALEEHLLVCPPCQDRLEETDDYVQAVRDAAIRIGGDQNRSLRQRLEGILEAPLASKLAWTAGILCLALGLAWMSGVRAPSPSAGSVPVAVMLRTARGAVEGSVASAPSGRPLLLEADLSGLPRRAAWRLSLVDASGSPVRTWPAGSAGAFASATVPGGLAKGAYWVRLYAASAPDQLVREYALRVE